MREMKDSGIEWIGAIPQDWKTDRLQWHLKEINVSNNPIQTKNILSLTIEAGVIPYAEKGNQGNKAKEDYSQYKIALPDTLVINSMNVIIGAVGISQYFGCVSPVYYVFEPIEGTDLRYIYYLFTNTGFQKEMRKYAKGILEIRLRISSNDMLKRIVPSPPFKEQQRIADYLDKMCAEIDAVLEKTRASIEEYKKLKQAVITQAVTKGIRGDRPMKNSGIEWIGEIPAEWSVVPFSKFARVSANLVNPSDYQDYLQVSPENIEKDSGKLLPCKTVSEVGVESWNHFFHKGQILYSKIRPKLNKVCIAPFDGLCSADMYPIDTDNISKFVVYTILSNDFNQQVAMITENRVKMPKINQKELSKIIVVLPANRMEQQEIVDYLDDECGKIDALIAKKQQYLTEIENYKKSLIYEYVTGKKEVV